MIEFAKIVVLGVVAAVCYGVLHDQVTARVCVEYFTIGHPPLFNTDSPTLLAFGWGVVGTWPTRGESAQMGWTGRRAPRRIG